MLAPSLLAGHQEINDLDAFAPPASQLPPPSNIQLVDKYVDSQGVSRVKGNSLLKQSQAYPPLPLKLHIRTFSQFLPCLGAPAASFHLLDVHCWWASVWGESAP